MAKRKKVSFVFDKERIEVTARECGFFSFGLMFRTKKTEPCVFEFGEPTNFRISSLFVGFPFVAIWFDEKNKIIDAKKVEPFTLSVSPRRKYHTLLEIPINQKYSKIVQNFGFQ